MNLKKKKLVSLITCTNTFELQKKKKPERINTEQMDMTSYVLFLIWKK